ncbi:MAG: hypothetical protein R3C18_18355 [Planctomycetaceae bacterium]
MSDWFSKATSVFRPHKDENPEPFQTLCDCGQPHMGIRRNRHQHLVCKTCGASLFILPHDPFPVPKQKAKSEPELALRDEPDVVEVDDVEYILEEEVEVVSESTPRQNGQSRQNIAERPPDMEFEAPPLPPRTRPQREKTEKKRVAEPPPAPAIPSVPVTTILGQFVSGLFTPLRFVSLALFVLVALTVFFFFRNHENRVAERTIQVEVEAGRAALAEADWLAARDHFAAAVDAFDTLGRNDLESREIRQLHSETLALTRLASGTLIDLIDEAELATEQFDAEQQNQLSDYVCGRHNLDWYIIEGPVRPRELKEKEYSRAKSHYELRFPWVTEESGRRIEVHVDFACFDELVTPNAETVVLFGGKLQDCRLDGDTWVVKFAPESGFLWTNPVTYRALQFPQTDEESFEILEFLNQQAHAAGVEL